MGVCVLFLFVCLLLFFYVSTGNIVDPIIRTLIYGVKGHWFDPTWEQGLENCLCSFNSEFSKLNIHVLFNTGANMTNFEVRVGNSENFADNPLCGNVTVDITHTTNLYCGDELRGRYVSVQVVSDYAELYLCEVQAFYSKYDDLRDVF